MAYTLQLTDGTTTLSLHGSVYDVLEGTLSMPEPPHRSVFGGSGLFRDGADLVETKYENREITMLLRIKDTTHDLLAADVAALHAMLQAARNYAAYGIGAQVTLDYKWDGATTQVSFDVLDASLDMPPSLETKKLLDNYVLHGAALRLVCRPFARSSDITLENYGLNPHFDCITGANLDGYTLLRATLAQDTSNKETGTQSGKITCNDAGGAGVSQAYSAVVWSASYQSQQFTLAVRLKATGDKAKAISLWDGVAEGKTAVPASVADWTWYTCTLTVDAAAASLSAFFFAKDTASADTDDTLTIDRWFLAKAATAPQTAWASSREVYPANEQPAGSNVAFRLSTANVLDGATVTIDTEVYEFDTNSSITPGNIQVDISADQTPTVAATQLAAAINANSTLVTAVASNRDVICTSKSNLAASKNLSASSSYGVWDQSTINGTGFSNLINWLDILEVPGDVPALTKFYLQSASALTAVLGVRSGSNRRADDLWTEGEDLIYVDSGKSVTASAAESSNNYGSYLNSSAASGDVDAACEFDVSSLAGKGGLYAVLARVQDNLGLPALAVGWKFGDIVVAPSSSDYVDITATWALTVIGTIQLPPAALPSDDIASTALKLRIYVKNQSAVAAKFDIDYVLLLPVDEAAVLMSPASSARKLIDGKGAQPGIYQLDSSLDVTGLPTDWSGRPPLASPLSSRFHFDENGNAGTVTPIRAVITPRYLAVG